MAIRNIVKEGDPILNKVCRPVTNFDDRLATLLDDMRETMIAADGVGLAGLAAARARGRKGARKFTLSKAQVRLAQAAMAQRDTSVSDLCKELGIERVTLYRYVGPKGELRDYGKRVLGLA